ncbi:hypothetical protein PSACC_00843 [Paramicrosporidium saccamoebae]|uniref:Uncharacterized protein n=1 Tax=Paramicrosporidium saccamoebae TaxID=1246581 RepID=A0A2H9TNL0_9FUNG|nr:hypothetical protein PSACC_00843 [Paramicrosporidium saccamoebae]
MSASTAPAMVPLCVSRSRRSKSPSTASTPAPSVDAYAPVNVAYSVGQREAQVGWYLGVPTTAAATVRSSVRRLRELVEL